MRELQTRSRYKIRRFAMHSESLFFLCAADDRWCRAYGVSSEGIHCTAFVRVYDYKVRKYTMWPPFSSPYLVLINFVSRGTP
ncbi:unnamed protein product [Gongylonema pulchrum]|uniref:WD_REPEATS_REGION domain-containing protein n=1 Tax=Gongylonema pulchrum TaxID=637853 RepID=A0A183DAT2_9BILA|nr:unnamed protein product [Gongylonema pulchrum]